MLSSKSVQALGSTRPFDEEPLGDGYFDPGDHIELFALEIMQPWTSRRRPA